MITENTPKKPLNEITAAAGAALEPETVGVEEIEITSEDVVEAVQDGMNQEDERKAVEAQNKAIQSEAPEAFIDDWKRTRQTLSDTLEELKSSKDKKLAEINDRRLSDLDDVESRIKGLEATRAEIMKVADARVDVENGNFDIRISQIEAKIHFMDHGLKGADA